MGIIVQEKIEMVNKERKVSFMWSPEVAITELDASRRLSGLGLREPGHREEGAEVCHFPQPPPLLPLPL